jgi:signal peptidase II
MKYSLWQSGVRWLWLAPLVIVLDQLTKLAILQNLPYGGPGINVLPVFNIVHVYNTGAAFSFLADQAGWQRWFFALFAIGVSLVMLVALRRQAASQWWGNCAFVLVIGGAIGNLIDRVLNGEVVVYINLLFMRFAVFNFADICVCVGVALWVLVIFLDEVHADDAASKEQ